MLRRSFLLSASGLSLSAATSTRPDQVLLNGKIYTARQGTGFRQVQALAIAGGKILASGDIAEMRGLAGPATKQIDLGGKTVVPGFNDAHTHVASAGLRHLMLVDCDLRTITEIRDAIRRRAAQTPKGQWVLGFKYDDTKTGEGRKVNVGDLDAAAPDHPVAITHRGGHSGFYNSLALGKGDVNAKTPQPAGGEIVHDAKGSLTGELRETAKNLIPIPESAVTPSDRREGVRLITKLFAKAGVTSAHDAGGSPADLRAYQDAHENGELYCRVNTLIQYRAIDQMIAAGIRTGFGNEWIRTGAMKLTSDGSISERTARLSQPYEGRPTDFGIQVMPEEQLWEIARKAHLAGWQIGTHANGDEGIDVALKVYERLQREHPRKDPRFRLEHCTVVNDALLRRIRALNAIPTPFWTYVYYHGEKMAEYGAARLDRMFAMRSFLDHGIRVAPGSDYVPGPFEPMMALQSCVTRTDSRGNIWGPSQRITVAECIDASTRNGAYASFEENVKGSLEPGMLADLVVLGRDPFTEHPSTLVSIPVERTMAGGRWVYES
ncbi:MAG: amidohydrolase [Acidobacteriia bacterium]|nr:amidohydrolase [Terriglobia bacterium]